MAIRKKCSKTTTDRIRIDVIRQSSREDVAGSTVTTVDLQVRKVLEVAPVSRSLASVLALLAFTSRRQP